MTRQVVWPQALLRHRADLLDVQRRLQAECERRGGPRPLVLAALTDELATQPCGHWDVEQHPAGVNDWRCTACHTVITPDWVAVNEQEHRLRRSHRLSPTRTHTAAT